MAMKMRPFVWLFFVKKKVENGIEEMERFPREEMERLLGDLFVEFLCGICVWVHGF